MRTWIRGGLFALLAFGVCWGGAIWNWRSTNRMPSSADLLLFMLALPLGLLACAVLFARVMKAQPAAPAAQASAPGAPAAASRAGLPALSLLDAAVRTPHGESAQELSAAIDAQSARADLDPELVDDAGYPLMSVRAAGAGNAGWRDEAESWLAAHGHDSARHGDAYWRALELASGVVTDLVDSAAALVAGSAPSAGADAAPPLLRIIPLAPVEWTPAQRSAAAAWLAHAATTAGWNDGRVVASPPPPGEPVAAALSLLSLLGNQADIGAEPALTILLAFDSRIDQAVVDTMAGNGILFSTARPQGLSPGEGAAGLLLADPVQGRLLDAGAPSMQGASVTRSASADASPRADATDLRRLAARVLSETAVEPSGVSVLVGDTDHRSSRVLELMSLAHEELPHLDAGADVKATGSACGQCGAVPLLATLALARHHVLEGASAVLCIGNADPIHRSAALVRPAGAALEPAT
jgi:hypothetical protein